MKKLSFVLISFLLVQNVHGQSAKFNFVDANNTSDMVTSHVAAPVLTEYNTVNIEDALFGAGWQQGYAIKGDSVKSNVTWMMYSTYTNEVSFIEDNKKHTVPSKSLNGFVLTGPDSKTVFKNGYTSKKYDIASDQMMRVIYDGKIQLLAKESSKLNRISGGKNPWRYRFTPVTTFYLVTGGNFHKVQLNRSDLLQTLQTDKCDALAAYAKKNNLHFNNEADIASIFRYYDKNLNVN